MSDLKPYTRSEITKVELSRQAVNLTWPIVLGMFLYMLGGWAVLIFALIVLCGAFVYNRSVSR